MIDAAPLAPDRIVLRLRRLVTLWRTLLIAQVTAVLLLGVLGLLEWLLPGVLPRLLRGQVAALPVLVGLAAFVAILDVGSAATERAMGSTLQMPSSPLRRAMTALSFVPGLLLARRLLLLGLACLWLGLLFLVLLLYILLVLVFALPMWLFEQVASVLGRFTDLADQILSALHALLVRALRAISATPVYRVDKEEDVVLPLLHRRRAIDAPAPPLPGDSQGTPGPATSP